MRRKMNINEIRELEKAYQEELRKLKKELIQILNHVKYPETKLIRSNIAVVKLSSLEESWLPSYHIPGIQSKELEKKIEKAATISSLTNIIDELISGEKINGLKLNPNLIKKLIELQTMFKEGKDYGNV